MSAFGTFRREGRTFREDGGGAFEREEQNGAATAVAAVMLASAAGPWDEPILLDAKRVGELEGFDRCVACVRHVRMDARHPRAVRERALATRDRLVVRERSRIGSSDRHVVHRALA